MQSQVLRVPRVNITPSPFAVDLNESHLPENENAVSHNRTARAATTQPNRR